MRLLFDNMSEGVDVYDSDRKVIYENRHARSIISTGDGLFNLETFTHQHTFFIEQDGHEQRIGIEDLPISRALRGELLDSVGLKICAPASPEYRWLEVSAMPLRDAEQCDPRCDSDFLRYH